MMKKMEGTKVKKKTKITKSPKSPKKKKGFFSSLLSKPGSPGARGKLGKAIGKDQKHAGLTEAEMRYQKILNEPDQGTEVKPSS